MQDRQIRSVEKKKSEKVIQGGFVGIYHLLVLR